MKIVLASQSPRRRQLLGQMGLEFTTQSPEIDEAAFQGRDARDLVQILSREKARNGAPFCPGSGETGTSLRSAPCWSGPGLWALPVF